MTTTNGNRKILDPKRWEFMTPSPVATAAGTFVVSSDMVRQLDVFVVNATTAYLYDAAEDGWIQLPSPALGGAFGAGACGVATTVGPTGTATGGSTTTINTNLTLARNLAGYKIHITAGTNAGETREILYNSIGANATITVTSAFTSAIDNTSVYRMLTPRFWVLNAVASAGTTTANLFKYYCLALNTWTSAETGATDGVAPAAVIGTDGRLMATRSWYGLDYLQFATGTATAGGASTITNSAKTWTTNQWTNYQIRIVSGTGAGQIRTIASNTGTEITVGTAWTTQPDNTSVYSIEGNDDHIYYIGSNAVTLYRYSLSGGAWSTLTPGTARAAAPGLGMSGHWIYAVNDDRWEDESAIINGRRLYSFRGTAGAVLDYYDIAANTWVNAVSYAPGTEVFGGGSKYVYNGNYMYIHKDATGRWFRFDLAGNEMLGWNTMLYPNGAALAGDTAWDVVYKDGATEIVYIHMILNTSAVHLRQMVI